MTLSTHEKDRQIEICKRCPGEKQLHHVVEELDLTENQRRRNEQRIRGKNLEYNFSEKALARRPYTMHENGGVDRGEK